MGKSHKVAVIGAGVAGLLAARELRNEGQQAVVFEKSNKVGGLWNYDPRTESDPLGNDPGREIIHSSVYQCLRTNLPRVLMGFTDFSFTEREYGDPRNFPGHEEVAAFLNDFALQNEVVGLVRFNSEVVRVEQVGERVDRWVVEWREKKEGIKVELKEEVFEAVVICNGHCTVPRVAHVPGIEKWPGKQIHSHNYRISKPYKNKVVIVIGNGPSAYDISRDISKVAKEVHLSSRSPNAKFAKVDHYDNIWQHSAITMAREDGTIEFEDGSFVQAKIIMHCTGYQYDFPFLNTNGVVTIDDNRVGPLYKHVFPPELAPWLSFVDLPQKTLIFDMMELQSKWIARVLSGKVALPSKEKMMVEVQEFYEQLSVLNRPNHLTHFLLNSEEYLDWLAEQAGVFPIEQKRQDVYWETLRRIENNEDGFRDELIF